MAKSAMFDHTPAEIWFGQRIVMPETFWRTWFRQSGIVLMVVQALHMTFSSVSQTDKMLTLNWWHSGVFLEYEYDIKSIFVYQTGRWDDHSKVLIDDRHIKGNTKLQLRIFFLQVVTTGNCLKYVDQQQISLINIWTIFEQYLFVFDACEVSLL